MTTILVVDDEFLVADVLMFALEDEGYQVRLANNGLRALEQLSREPVDLIITDYMMPSMNGMELAETIRTSLGEESPPIIMMSGAQAHIGRRRTDLFAAVFDKPFKMAEIMASVRDIVGAAS